jgi:hypothetical protein
MKKTIILVLLSFIFVSMKADAGGGRRLSWHIDCKGPSVSGNGETVSVGITHGSKIGVERFFEVGLSDQKNNLLFQLRDYVPSKEATFEFKPKEILIKESTILSSIFLELKIIEGKHQGQFWVQLGNKTGAPMIGSKKLVCK